MVDIGIDYVDCDAGAGLLPKLSAIDASVKPATLAEALVSPNNPAGSIYPAKLLDDILTLCLVIFCHETWVYLTDCLQEIAGNLI